MPISSAHAWTLVFHKMSILYPILKNQTLSPKLREGLEHQSFRKDGERASRKQRSPAGALTRTYSGAPSATRAGTPPSVSSASAMLMRWQVKIGVSRSV